MPGQFLTKAEREQLSSFPPHPTEDDIITFFALTASDLSLINKRSGDYNRLGCALQLGTLRYLGFVPDELPNAPFAIVDYLAQQLQVNSSCLLLYGKREKTRTNQLQQIQSYLGWRKSTQMDLLLWENWLLERAMEHDRPILLFQLICDKLRCEKIVRPAVTTLERMVINARSKANTETFNRLQFLLTTSRKSFLDSLLERDANTGKIPITWLRLHATTNSPNSILNALAKLTFLAKHDVHHWNLSGLNPNRIKFLAQLGKKSSNQALKKINEERRYPILVAFVWKIFEEVTDETMDLYIHCLGDYDRLVWFTNWYLREETLKEANTTLVNFQYHQWLSQFWGGGTLSSSDGQRFPVAVNNRQAVALPRYFGYGKGLTFYTWTSDQHSQYGDKVIPSTMRDAPYLLDAILDNETELNILEHTTDTAGYTDVIFALFDLLGLQFSPRLRALKSKCLYLINKEIKYPNLKPLFKGKIRTKYILNRWDNLLRVVGSLKLGWVTSSLFIGKLQSFPQQNGLLRALQEYGRLVKTNFILRYLNSEDYRRRINTQLNKGEKLHDLRRFLFFAHLGLIRHQQDENLANQSACLTLVTNAVVAWNTIYMQAVIEQLSVEGLKIDESDFVHLSPARYEHINPYGRYEFDVAKTFSRQELRPLRNRRDR